MSRVANRRKPLVAIILGGGYHSRHRGRVLEEDLPLEAPEGIAPDLWRHVLDAQAQARAAETVKERRRALAYFWESVSVLPVLDVAYVPTGIPLSLRDALILMGPRSGYSDDELREGWDLVKDERPSAGTAEWMSRRTPSTASSKAFRPREP